LSINYTCILKVTNTINPSDFVLTSYFGEMDNEMGNNRQST